MALILIADAGSSKTDWVLADENGNVRMRHCTRGINAALINDHEIKEILSELKKHFPDNCKIDEIYFYGAGCATPVICGGLSNLLKEVLESRHAEVNSDLLAAARSLCGDRPGIACILGTGSNSCYYDGEKIEDNVPSLGFILGDEGGGAALGKRLVSDCYKRLLPSEIRSALFEEYFLTYAKVISLVYKSDRPNRFLASLVPFIEKNLNNSYIRELVYEEFDRFVKRNLLNYPNINDLPVNFIGGIASTFEDILKEVLESNNLRCGKIIKRPLDALIEFHTSRK